MRLTAMAGCCLACLLAVTGAQAQEQKGFHGYLSLGAGAVPDYDGSDEYRPIPAFAGRIAYNEYYLDLRGLRLRANVMPSGLLPFGLELGPLVARRFGRGDVGDNRVDRMRDIDGAMAVGGFVRFSTSSVIMDHDEIGFEVESLTGLGDDGHGTTIRFGPSYSFFVSQRLRFSIATGVTYAGDSYNETYFGIDAHDAIHSGFDRYHADGGIKDVGLTLNASYQFTRHWGITGTVGVTQLLGDAADSPIVKDAGSATQGLVTAGVTYRF